MSDAAARELLSRMLLQAAAGGDGELFDLLTPAAEGKPGALEAFKKALEASGYEPEKAGAK